jgi:diaminohydroxyphosphoribosylaminopyrimidine deaminase/5-amino-6-(5-phosphoribosylamino)uracil reductase
VNDTEAMLQAIELAAAVRGTTAPNPWVGCVIESPDGRVFTGATHPPGGPHAEAAALAAAGDAARGGTAWVTLEPCPHTGRTPPCADALIDAGIRRVVVAIEDPDPKASGAGLQRLRDAGLDVVVGVEAPAVRLQLAPYVKHRTTGRPWVVLKLGASIDGRTAAPDGSSRWITGGAARADAHQLRAVSDAIVVGANTVRIDDPSLTVRHVAGSDPLRVVLGRAAPDAKVQPALEFEGELSELLGQLGQRGVLQVLVEGGATVAGAFHRERLVDQYVFYVAPVIFGGADARPMFDGPGAPTIADVWRGAFSAVVPLGADLRLDLVPALDPATAGAVPVGRAAGAAEEPITGSTPAVPADLSLPVPEGGD